jgi:hypothetical protein
MSKKRQELADRIVVLFDDLWSERSIKARHLATDIADAAHLTGNKEVEAIFRAVHDAFDYGDSY